MPSEPTARPLRNRYAIPLTALIAAAYVPGTETSPTRCRRPFPPASLTGFDTAGAAADITHRAASTGKLP